MSRRPARYKHAEKALGAVDIGVCQAQCRQGQELSQSLSLFSAKLLVTGKNRLFQITECVIEGHWIKSRGARIGRSVQKNDVTRARIRGHDQRQIGRVDFDIYFAVRPGRYAACAQFGEKSPRRFAKTNGEG